MTGRNIFCKDFQTEASRAENKMVAVMAEFSMKLHPVALVKAIGQ